METHSNKPSVNLARDADDKLRKKYADEKARDALENEGGILGDPAPPAPPATPPLGEKF